MEVLSIKGDTTIRWYRGDTKTITIVTSDEAGGKENTLKDMRVTFTAKERFHEKKILEKTAIISDAPVSLFFSHEETKAIPPGQYRYDIELRKEDYSVVCTLYTGTLIIETDVTRKDGA